MNKSILRSDKKTDVYYYLLFFGAIFFIFLSLLKPFPISFNSAKDYLELTSKVFLGLLGIYFLYYVLSIDIIEVYTDRLEILTFYSRTKKIILRSEIIEWTETVKYSRYGKFNALTIFTNNNKYKIHESSYTNYIQIRNEITKGKMKTTASESFFGSGQSKFDTIVIVVGLLFILSIYIYQQISK